MVVVVVALPAGSGRRGRAPRGGEARGVCVCVYACVVCVCVHARLRVYVLYYTCRFVRVSDTVYGCVYECARMRSACDPCVHVEAPR